MKRATKKRVKKAVRSAKDLVVSNRKTKKRRVKNKALTGLREAVAYSKGDRTKGRATQHRVKQPMRSTEIDRFWIDAGHITGGIVSGFPFYLDRVDGSGVISPWVICAGCRRWNTFAQARKHYNVRSWKSRHRTWTMEEAKDYCTKAVEILRWLEAVAKRYDLRVLT